jgi:hypothetical protein
LLMWVLVVGLQVSFEMIDNTLQKTSCFAGWNSRQLGEVPVMITRTALSSAALPDVIATPCMLPP